MSWADVSLAHIGRNLVNFEVFISSILESECVVVPGTMWFVRHPLLMVERCAISVEEVVFARASLGTDPEVVAPERVSNIKYIH